LVRPVCRYLDHSLLDVLVDLRTFSRPAELIPRVLVRRGDAARWPCAFFFADITGACTYGGENVVAISGLKKDGPAVCSVICAADRYGRAEEKKP